LDYLEVNSPDDVIQAIQQLQQKPQLYRAMVENGWQRAQAFTPDTIALLWRNLLADPIAIGYKQWMQELTIWKMVGRPLQFGHRLMQQERERRHFNQLTGRKK